MCVMGVVCHRANPNPRPFICHCCARVSLGVVCHRCGVSLGWCVIGLTPIRGPLYCAANASKYMEGMDKSGEESRDARASTDDLLDPEDEHIYKESEAVIKPSQRPHDRQMVQRVRHFKLGHHGPCPPTCLPHFLRGSLRCCCCRSCYARRAWLLLLRRCSRRSKARTARSARGLSTRRFAPLSPLFDAASLPTIATVSQPNRRQPQLDPIDPPLPPPSDSL